MNDFTTKLTETLLNNAPLEEFFRKELETALNSLLKTELDAFLGYEKYAQEGYNGGDSRNGCYYRTLQTKYGTLQLEIPRDRFGEFKQRTIPPYTRSDHSLENTIIQLYSKGITTREISELIERMYGQYYSAQTVSTITQNVEEQVQAFHARNVQSRYIAVYCDATCLNVRRDTVEKECLHILLGITEDGTKEILDYALFPTERAENYVDMLQNLQERGLEEVLLFVTDGLPHVHERLLECFPKAKHQYCWTHLARNIMKYIRKDDKERVMDDFKQIHQQEDAAAALNVLVAFGKKYQKLYPKIVEKLSDLTGVFEFYNFPKSIRQSIYTTNIIENWNKEIKRQVKKKIQFPNEDSLDRFICMLALEYNRKFSMRVHKGFDAAKAEIDKLF